MSPETLNFPLFFNFKTSQKKHECFSFISTDGHRSPSLFFLSEAFKNVIIYLLPDLPVHYRCIQNSTPNKFQYIAQYFMNENSTLFSSFLLQLVSNNFCQFLCQLQSNLRPIKKSLALSFLIMIII